MPYKILHSRNEQKLEDELNEFEANPKVLAIDDVKIISRDPDTTIILLVKYTKSEKS